MCVGLMMSLLLSHYLNPTQFGSLSYSIALVSLIVPVATLGLDNIVLIDLTSSPLESYKTIGTTFCLRLVAGMFSTLLCIAIVLFLRPDAKVVLIAVSILSVGIVLKATESLTLWFTYQVKAKHIVLVRNCATLIACAIQTAMIFYKAPVIAFAWAMLLETTLSAIGFMLVYQAFGNSRVSALRFDFNRAKSLLARGWPLIFYSLAVTVYMKIDQLMIGQIAGDEILGIYAVAARISEAVYCLPIAIISSLTPALIEAKEEERSLYHARFQRLFSLMVLIGISASLFISLTAVPIINYFYGAAYANAGNVLAVHIWSFVFVCLGVAQSVWVTNENLQVTFLIRALCGSLINIFLNLALIPKYGAMGATVSTLFSYVVINYLFNAIQPETRHIFKMQSKAFLLSQLVLKNVG